MVLHYNCVCHAPTYIYGACRYTTKVAAPADFTHDPDVARRVGLTNATPEMLRLLSASVFAHVASSCEVATAMSNVPMITATDPVVVISSAPPERRMCQRWGQRLAPNNSLQRYMVRPESMEALNFFDYHTRYFVSKVRGVPHTHTHTHTHTPARPSKHRAATSTPWAPCSTHCMQAAQETAPVATDGLGASVYERARGQIVRFSTYNPGSQPNEFVFQVQLQHVCFRTESELLSGDNTSCIDECYDRGIITCEEDLQVGACIHMRMAQYALLHHRCASLRNMSRCRTW